MLRILSEYGANVGPLDRAFRMVLGVVLIALVFVGPQSLWGLAGIVPLVSGFIGYSPIYALFGFSTIGSPHRIMHA